MARGGGGLLTVDQTKLRAVAAKLMSQDNGRKLKAAFGKELRIAVEPALPVIRTELMQMGGSIISDPPLRQAVADNLSSNVRTTGNSPGVRVRIARKSMPRGFDNAARRINAGQWSHPVYGRAGTSVTQTGRRGFFDDPLQARKDEMRRAIAAALDSWAAGLGSDL